MYQSDQQLQLLLSLPRLHLRLLLLMQMHHPIRNQITVAHPQMIPLAQSAVDATAASVLLVTKRQHKATRILDQLPRAAMEM
jgi:hypothetical protein